MTEYIELTSVSDEQTKPVEVKQNEQRTPERIIIKYETTGKIKNISKNVKDISEEDIAR